jgi:hypothetical protein
MRILILAAAASIALATIGAASEAPSARALYVERRGLIEADARCHLFAAPVRAALQVSALQARGTLLRGGWSLSQVAQLEQATADAADQRTCTDPRTLAAAASARQAYNTSFRSNTMDFPGWSRSWSARRIAAADGWRLRQAIPGPLAASFGVRQTPAGEQLVLILPLANPQAAPTAARLELRNPRLAAGSLDLAARMAGGLDAAAPNPLNSIAIPARPGALEHPNWFQTQIVYVFPNDAFRLLCALDPRESAVIELSTPAGAARELIEVGDIAAAAGFLATRAD